MNAFSQCKVYKKFISSFAFQKSKNKISEIRKFMKNRRFFFQQKIVEKNIFFLTKFHSFKKFFHQS